MKVQSLSLCSPAGCNCACKFCVSEMHRDETRRTYPNLIQGDLAERGMHEKEYARRMAFARDNGCNSAIITGDGEPLVDMRFLDQIAKLNWSLQSPFRWIEIQTNGCLLDDDRLSFLRGTVGVSTISLSVVDIFNDDNNAEAMGMKKPYHLATLCNKIVEYGFNLRISLNLTSYMNQWTAEEILERIKDLEASQLTLRQMYSSPADNTPQDNWIKNHEYKRKNRLVHNYVKDLGRPLERLPFGAVRYSINGMSTVIDEDCMNTEVTDAAKYLILRPNCKLYTRWDDEGSLLF